jgi:hypothetical protein
VSSLDNEYYRLVKGDALQIVRIREAVSRGKADELGRLFGISIGRFFPSLKVVSIDRLPEQMQLPKKASGETS